MLNALPECVIRAVPEIVCLDNAQLEPSSSLALVSISSM